MSRTKTNKTDDTMPLTDHRLAAAATVLGGKLRDVVQDPASGRLTFFFEGLSPTFVQDCFNGEIQVSVRDFIAALDQIMGLIHQFKARKGR